MTHDERAGDPVGGHADLDTLAELAEGLLDDARATSVREHLASCQECRQRAEELADVSRLLAAAAPAAMPVEVATRIDAALSAAADEGGASGRRPSDQAGPGQRPGDQATGRATDQPADRVVPLRRRRRLQVGLGAAAAALVLVVGGLAGVRALVGDTGEVTSAGGSEPNVAQREGTRAGGEDASAPQTNAAQQQPVLASGADYSAATVGEQVSRLMRRRLADDSPTGEATPDALRPLADPARLRACIAAVTGDPARQPVLVDLARYEGEPAAVIVLPAEGPARGPAGNPTDDTQPPDLWVVGRSCSAGQPDVLRHTQLPR